MKIDEDTKRDILFGFLVCEIAVLLFGILLVINEGQQPQKTYPLSMGQSLSDIQIEVPVEQTGNITLTAYDIVKAQILADPEGDWLIWDDCAEYSTMTGCRGGGIAKREKALRNLEALKNN